MAGAHVAVLTPQGSLVAETESAADGSFTLPGLPAGSLQVRVEAQGFAPRTTSLASLDIVLDISEIRSTVTVTALRGAVDDVNESARVAAVREQELRQRPTPTIAQVLENTPGVLLQQTTYAQASPFLRGLTGYHVLNLIDGVRFNNSTFRSGPNQYLAFVEPTQAQRVEAVLGPAGAQYGSDAMGGAIQVLTPDPRFASDRWETHGDLQVQGASADASGGVNGSVALANATTYWLIGASRRRMNDLRAGGGIDSRHTFRRLFGLDTTLTRDLLGSRQQDTGFDQWGAQTKLAFRLPRQQSLTLWYQRGAQDNVRNYKDLWGGLGRLQSSFAPQDLHFGYVRYEKLGVGLLDSVSGTVSVNSQGDGSIRQNLRATDTATHDRNRVTSWGYAAQATTHIGAGHALVFGGEFFRERIDARRFNFNPTTGVAATARALYPNGSIYTPSGVFVQDTALWLGGRLRWTGGLRWTHVGFRTPEDLALGVIDSSQSFRDLTFNTSLSLRATRWMSVFGVVGRGFRAPNLNDLGAVGLNDLGFEIPASDASAAGALLAATAGENALSKGQPLGGLAPERLFNYEAGVRFHAGRFSARIQAYDAELYDPIVRRTLLFPAGNVPARLGTLDVTPIAPTPQQQAQGVVTVRTAFDSRAVKAFVNDGRARYYGGESLVEYAFSSRWRLESGYAFIAGRDLFPNRPIRRLPPQMGHLRLRHTPTGRRPWLEGRLSFAGPQSRLSGGDRDDERIGGARSRNDIAAFFNGARVAPYIRDGVFTPTGETLRQIQDRVLPAGIAPTDATRVALHLATAGWAVIDVLGGYPLAESVDAHFGVLNLLDRNYRLHGSGLDAPGINAFLGLRWRF